MGETCGQKLVYQNIHEPGKCAMCQQIDRKVRRWEKARADYARWINDPKRQASAAKAAEDGKVLEEEIKRLVADREARKRNVGSGRDSRRDSVMRR